MIITEIPHFSSKIIRFQVTLKSAVEFTCALEFKISSQLSKIFFPNNTYPGSFHLSVSQRYWYSH